MKLKAPVGLMFFMVPVFTFVAVFFPLFTAMAVEERLGPGAGFLAFPVCMGGVFYLFYKFVDDFWG